MHNLATGRSCLVTGLGSLCETAPPFRGMKDLGSVDLLPRSSDRSKIPFVGD
jgi:hypothetical protein